PTNDSSRVLSAFHPRQRTPTPFPYTTLFRSSGHPRDPFEAGECFGMPQPVRGGDPPEQPRGDDGVGEDAAGAAAGDVLAQQRAQDRKSTRLNSSHVKISYAVFCLKKKTSPFR